MLRPERLEEPRLQLIERAGHDERHALAVISQRAQQETVVDQHGTIRNPEAEQKHLAPDREGFLHVKQREHQQCRADQADQQHHDPRRHALLVAVRRIQAEDVDQRRENDRPQQDGRHIRRQPHLQVIARDDEVRAHHERHRDDGDGYHDVNQNHHHVFQLSHSASL